MRKLLIGLGLFTMLTNSALAKEVPQNVQDFVKNEIPNATFRFDGMVIMPDNTLYLPLFPARDINPEAFEIASTYPEDKTIKDLPDTIIFNNDFVLMKVIVDENGDKTVHKFNNPPTAIETGLLSQDLLVPTGLHIPEIIKSIVGNLKIDTTESNGIKIKVQKRKKVFAPRNSKSAKKIAGYKELQDKVFYIASPYSKNIHVITPGETNPEYGFAQINVPIAMKAFDNQFLLVTAYDKMTVDIISLADDKIIKQINLKSQPDEILIDNDKKIAYVTSATTSSIYMIDLTKMTLIRQLKITGMPTRTVLSQDGTKLFYFDRMSGDIWGVELDNNYLLKEIGRFPNVSKIAYSNGKIYITSRTKNHLAVIDYESNGIIAELTVCEKPIDMLAFGDNIYVICATQNIVQVLNTKIDAIVDTINLNTNGFSTKIYNIDNTNFALITDTKKSMYTIYNLETNEVVETVNIDVPINTIITTNKVQKIND